MTMPTPDLAAIIDEGLRLADKATPGPWVKRGDESFGYFVEHPRQPGKAFGQEILGEDAYPTLVGDCDFVAFARNNLKTILLALTTHREQVAALVAKWRAESDAELKNLRQFCYGEPLDGEMADEEISRRTSLADHKNTLANELAALSEKP